MKFTTHFELHSQTTRLVEGASPGRQRRPRTGFSPSATSRSRELRPGRARSILYKLQLGPRPDFKFELLPLHSPLLGQSLLVSLPPLIDMLKFSGYPYLIRGQPVGLCRWRAHAGPRSESVTALGAVRRRHCLWGAPRAVPPNTKRRLRAAMTLGQACPPECQGAQCAFKDSMIH
jgi:hypothetical protein